MGKAGVKTTRLENNKVQAIDEFRSKGIINDDEIILPKLDPANPEKSYSSLVPQIHRKRFGQFFTPKPIAKLMAEWVTENNPSYVLDPAVGPGILVREVLNKTSNSCEVECFDIDPIAIEAAKQVLSHEHCTFHTSDFLENEEIEHTKFDAVVANPPYLRHHDFSYNYDIHGQFSKSYNLKISKLSNIYLLFIIKAISSLKPQGRAAFIAPTEWTNANFGQSLKQFLIENGYLKKILYFSHEGLVFDDNYSTACVLLIENNNKDEGVNVAYIDHEVKLESIKGIFDDPGVFTSEFSSEFLKNEPKWDYLFMNGSQESIDGLVPLKSFAKTKRGIATGANDFFCMNLEKSMTSKIQKSHLRPCITKAQDSKGFIFNKKKFEDLKKNGKRCFLLDLSDDLDEHEKAYINDGIKNELNDRYLLKQRTPWYSMEKREPAPIWAAVFGRGIMKFVYNEANIYNLTTFHCIYPEFKDELSIRALAACLNSNFIQSRARSNSRVYGGGLVKFEPKDLLEIEVPDISKLSEATLKKLASFLDTLEASSDDEMFNDLDREVQNAIKEVAKN